MGQRFSRDLKKDEILPARTWCALHVLIDFLKRNVMVDGIFRNNGRETIRRKVLACLHRGDIPMLRQVLEGSVIECAAALKAFIIQMKDPVIPMRVQELLLANNPGIPASIVASDALGLLRQDLSGRHLDLMTALLNLLHEAMMKESVSEQRGCNLPVVMLPIFFHIQANHLPHWRHLAARFSELIMMAPDHMTTAGLYPHLTSSQSEHHLGRTLPNRPIILQRDYNDEAFSQFVLQQHRHIGGMPGEMDVTLPIHIRLHPILRGVY